MGISNKIFRRAISGLIATTLAFAGVAAVSAPAQAALTSGCDTSNFSPSKCGGGYKTLPDLKANVGSLTVSTDSLDYNAAHTSTTTVQSCVPATYYLYESVASGAALGASMDSVDGMDFNSQHGTFTSNNATGVISVMASKSYTIVAACSNTAGNNPDFQTFKLNIIVTNFKSLPDVSTWRYEPVSTDALDNNTSKPNVTVSGACAPTAYELYVGSPDTYTGNSIDSLDGLDFNVGHGTFSKYPTAALSTTTYTIKALCSGAAEFFSIDVTVLASKALSDLSKRVNDSVSTDALDSTGTVSSVTTSSLCGTATYALYDSADTGFAHALTSVDGIDFYPANGTFGGTARTEQTQTSYTIVASCAGVTGPPLVSAHTQSFTIKITVQAALPTSTPPTSTPGNSENEKVTICHRTHATTNPYVRITVSIASVMNKAGHESHDEIYLVNHVYDAKIKYPAKDKKWGDIIPADPTGQNRWKALNWTTLGASIWNGSTAGCPTMTTQQYYNALRESGVPAKNLKKEVEALEAEQEKPVKTDVSKLKYDGKSETVLEQENDKVTICHATNSVTNPYRKITVSVSSVTNKAGHMSHDDIYLTHHVFDSTVNYPANKKDWGDIIPEDPTGKNRWAALNMTDLGKEIYAGTKPGCAEETTQEHYNKLREDGLTKKEILEEMRKDGNVDDDPADIEDLKYDGPKEDVKKTEPAPPVDPANVKIPDQSLSGIVWLDLNRDGFKDPDEPLMKGIKLTVVQVSSVTATPTPAFFRGSSRGGFRVANAKAAAVTTTVTTDANGFYLFASLGAGDWQVVTAVPADLAVTYDSQGSNEGEIIATVPVASHAFTYVGLISDDEAVNNKLVEENTPKTSSVDPVKTPTTPTKTGTTTGTKTSTSGKTTKPGRVASGNLAYTGDTPETAPMGVGVLVAMLGLSLIAATGVVSQRRRKQNS